MSQGKFLSIVIAFIAAFSPASSQARNADSFSARNAGLKTIQWKDFEPIQENMYTCLSAEKITDPTCQQVQRRGMDYLFDALNQAVVLNNLPNHANNPRFCDSYALTLVSEGRIGPGASYAILLIDERLQAETAPYGKALPETYLDRIVFDSLVSKSPCK